jgi:hypothetical protein
MSKLSLSNNLIQIAESVLSEKRTLADLRTEIDTISSEVRTPPVGGCTGDTSGPYYVDGPWTCTDCPQPLTVNHKHPRARTTFGGKHVIEFFSDRGELVKISTLPERCTDCDTTYRKHKRTTKAIRAVFYHPNRMYKPKDEPQWCFVPKTKYRHIKLITLEHPTAHLHIGQSQETATERSGEERSDGRPDGLVGFAQQALQELKEKFRRKRKLQFWNNHAVYGRWFAEVTWTVHYQDGTKSAPTQWMPGEDELTGAVLVSIHPHLHVVTCSKFMEKEDLTDWWDYGTHIRATDRWMVCKDYLTKYVNKQQLQGRHQGTFGSVKKK